MKIQEKKAKMVLNIIKENINNNLKEYIILAILFLIGIIIGVLILNYSQINFKEEISNYITTFISNIKDGQKIDYINLLKDVIIKDAIYIFFIWFMGCTVIGIPIVYGLTIFRGFSLGYTISAIIFTLGTGKGILFCIITLLFQNLLIIPSILASGVSSIKLYKTMTKHRKKENIKLEILRHTFFSIFILIILIIASFIEVYISNYLLCICINWF